nr:DUF3558 domain-containing protein [Prauserella isguenensis]
MVSACSSSEGGQPIASQSAATPSPDASSPASTNASGDPLADVDPCSLLSAQELSKYGTFPAGVREDVGTDRGCNFEKDTDSPTTDPNRVITVGVRDEEGIDDAQDNGQGIDRGESGGREFARIPGAGVCTIVIGVSESSRVDITTVATEGTEKSCEIADEVAAIVEPKLPQG